MQAIKNMPIETARFTQRQNLDVPLIAATDTSSSFAYGGHFFAENAVRPSVLRALRPPAKVHPQSQYVGGLRPHSPVITPKCRQEPFMRRVLALAPIVSCSGVVRESTKVDQIFGTLLTVQPQVSGKRLAISGSIVESHRGRLGAMPNHGAAPSFNSL